ncbi:lytic transglycosylase domain-containing protein [Williamwhitmania taraxaci]|uniref:Transglycosylase SLT domain-containing protein n=1 Tax=Williamwhitmania taraxaci TaxID=1640674 RepID=A0A1G6LSD9_9BACT|nr:lytic transglycosylase domain-containing protein [Williamwhitmania taraxaci]SDC46119.1 Transglycosylase SLT domain-containing protein [Williamwhitmania taraxaci]
MLKKIVLIAGLVLSCCLIAGMFLSFSEDGKSIVREIGASFQSIEAVGLPDSLYFANERVPLENFDTKESLDREMLVNSYWHSQTIYLLKLSTRYFPVIEPILKREGVPDDFKYLALAESGLQQLISPAKAVGMWQILEATAKEEGLEVSPEVDERYNVEKATLVACNYLKRSYATYGNWTMAAASYNIGRTGLLKQATRQDRYNYYDLLLGEETGRYMFRILALKLIFQTPAHYGFDLTQSDYYPALRFREVEVDSSITRISDFAAQMGTSYKMIKYFNPWLREASLNNPMKKKYTIKIPIDGFRTEAYIKNN